MTNKNEVDIFDEKNRFARDLAESWMQWKEVGDKCGGIVRDIFTMPSRDGMPEQICFTIEQDGTLINVGLKKTGYILDRTSKIQVGDKMGVKFVNLVPSKTKGYSPAKSFVIFSQLVGDRIQGTMAQDVVANTPKSVESEIAF